ncbi:hypothetical protein EW146_g3930 [Bondarzewia mesenterica]|uniref:C3H1-type domain-containing protein n=1 Tax=Bondarzewia mesenterica TaxID=1095465 RepID=A0A4S4M1Y1_9AGAM|nr:hypothetical protein EW146_g3930 [Bondarzewia mesenterica]
MLFDPSTAEYLKPWLTKTLEPICDAEPGALADYILALLKHNAPEIELRKELASQLEEFLEKGGVHATSSKTTPLIIHVRFVEVPTFINMLFTTLRTKSYLPYSTSSPSRSTQVPVDNGIPIPLDALIPPTIPISPERGRKRNMDYDERDGRPVKGPRLSHDGQPLRHMRGHDNWGNGGYGRGDRGRREGYVGGSDSMDGGMGVMGMNGRGQYRPPDQKKGICRDYYNNGYCARGAYCKFSHGEDAGGMGFGVNNGPAAYDPHEARMDMRPSGSMGMGGRPSRPSVMARGRGENGDGAPYIQSSGELPVIQDLTPRDQNEETAPPTNGFSNAPGPSGEAMGNGMGISVHGPMPVKMEVDIDLGSQMTAVHHQPPRPMRPMRGGRGGAVRPGIFSGDVQRFRPERRNDKTLVVEKIPEDKLSLETVNTWFKQFGTVTNVAIDAPSAKALVSFSTHEEAHAAWKSEEAVFNNRFVKLFWHRPMEGHGQVGQRMLAASAPLVANISNLEKAPTVSPAIPTSAAAKAASPPPTSPAPVVHARRPSATPSAAVSALAAKQQLLERQIAEQKSLMEKLGAASVSEKKEILARLRKLGEEMKPPATPATPARPSTSTAKTWRAPSTPRPDDREQKERERLDKELELHSAVQAADGEEDSTESLKEKLARLKAEVRIPVQSPYSRLGADCDDVQAASLGIDAIAEYSYGTPFRGYRGRGRGARSYYRGAMRGGHVRSNMKLDNRPKKLFVKDVGADAVQAVRDWYETTGQVESVEVTDSGDVIVSFKSRSGAEQGLAKGNTVPLAGQKQVAWYTPPASTQSPAPKPAPPSAGTPESSEGRRQESEAVHVAGTETQDMGHEEEMIATGWGGDGEDEDGMGML